MDTKRKALDVDQPYLTMTLILSEHQYHKFARLAKEKNIRGGLILLGKGTVKNAALNLFGIKSEKKQMVSFLLEKETAGEMLDYFTQELQLDEPGHGIAYTTRVLTACQVLNKKQEMLDAVYAMEAKYMYKKLTVVVNRGQAEDVMEIARKSGVKGGTILHGRGTGAEFTAKFFGMEIEPEKELVVMLLKSDLVETVAGNLYRELKLDSPGRGILFVEPVVDVRGLFDGKSE